MKIGRNDPCPCGSGKKYKKCCLQKDEARRVEERTVNAPKPTTAPTPVDVPPAKPKKPAPPPDPLVEKRNTLFDTFQSRDYEGRIELFLSSMDEPELLDDEGAFEMLNNIHPDAVKRGEYARFNDLVDTLSQKLPELYADSEAYHLDWYISNALVLDQPDVLANKVRELAEISYSHLNIFHWTVDRLAYHGYLPLLIEAMRIAWPEVKAARDIMGFAIDEFTETAINFEIFDYIGHHPEADPDDPDLLGRLKYFYDDIRTDILTKDIMYLSARAGRRWLQDDFGNLKSETSRMDLIHLSREFLGELYREQGMSITRGELGRYQLVEYLLKRVNGDLEPTPSMFEAVRDQKKRYKPKPKPKQSRPFHILCPDRESFDRFLGGILHFINPQIYKAVACFEIIPEWLAFLQSRGLIDDELRDRSLNNLRPFRETMEKIVHNYFPDPAQRPTIKEF